MNGLKEYIIPFVGLKNGVHKLNYKLTDEFFENFEESIIKKCKIDVDFTIDKQESFFVLNFNFSGITEIECDRCLDLMNQEIFGDYTAYVKFASEEVIDDKDEDVIFIDRNETHLDISQLLYDYLHVSLPLKRTHPVREDGSSDCNPEVLKFYSKESDKEKNEIDPRWSALTKIQKSK